MVQDNKTPNNLFVANFTTEESASTETTPNTTPETSSYWPNDPVDKGRDEPVKDDPGDDITKKAEGNGMITQNTICANQSFA